MMSPKNQKTEIFRERFVFRTFGVLLLSFSCLQSHQSIGQVENLRDPTNILMPVEIVSRAYIEETQSDDLIEALQGSAGIVTNSIPTTENDLRKAGRPIVNPVESRDFSPSNSGGAWGNLGSNFDNSLAIRGFTNPTQQRLGFRLGAAYGDGRSIGNFVDSSNIDHINIYRGPAGLLFGQNTLSGVVEVVPKRPLSTQTQSFRVVAGSDAYRRIEVDLTGPLTTGLNYRAIGARQSEDHWTQWQNSDRTYGAIQLSYTPSDNFNLFLEYQYSDDRHEGIGPQYAFDVSESDLSIDSDEEWFGEPINWARSLLDAEENFRWSGPDTYFDRLSRQFIAVAEFNPLEQLSINLSGTLNNIDTEERNVDLETIVLTPFAARFYPEARYLGGNYYRLVSGSFYDYELSVENIQLKAEASYQFSLLNGHHLITLGRSYLKDSIRESGVTPEIGKLQRGILKSVDDPTPFRYIETSRYQDQLLNLYFGSHMVQDDTFWILNDYALYRGIYFEDRLQVFIGSRWERFHARELRRSKEPEQDIVIYQARKEIGPLRSDTGYRYGGEALNLHSFNGGIGFRINQNLTLYALHTEGYNPNQGQVDGNGNAIDEETTTGAEVGLMFDLFDGRVSGWLGYYEIERENAVWSHWLKTPAPATWSRSELFPAGIPASFIPFDPDAAAINSAPLSYGIHQSYLSSDQLAKDASGRFLNQGILGESGEYVYIDYSTIDQNGLRPAMEAAFLSSDENAFSYNPVWVDGRMLGNNPDALVFSSESYYANVPFTEVANGFDFQVIVTATPNWQVEIKYAYSEREVTEMRILDYIDLDTGVNWGTEYNQQARQIGRDQFADPSRPSTLKSGLLVGKDFGVTPHQLLTIWNRYQFDRTLLPGFTLGLGIRYTGAQPTSVPIGGNLLQTNSFPTPETESYWLTDLSLGYKHDLRFAQLKTQITVYNVFDKRHLEQIVRYSSQDGTPVMRRSVREIAPLSVRISAGISF